jgi:hypothetical protein
LGSSVGVSAIGGHHRHVGLEINQFTTRRHKEIPVSPSDLALGDIGFLILKLPQVLAGKFQHPSTSTSWQLREASPQEGTLLLEAQYNSTRPLIRGEMKSHSTTISQKFQPAVDIACIERCPVVRAISNSQPFKRVEYLAMKLLQNGASHSSSLSSSNSTVCAAYSKPGSLSVWNRGAA